uniref:Smoothelin domain-containing protein n=1 Tax=Ascaris lumbricoides TaxID=6252 RepID=A0A0M3HPN9_ASCLU
MTYLKDEKDVHDLRLRLERIALAKLFRRERLSEMEKLAIAAVRQRHKLKCASLNNPVETSDKK